MPQPRKACEAGSRGSVHCLDEPLDVAGLLEPLSLPKRRDEYVIAVCDGMIDLKKSGARLFVDVARILSLRAEVTSSSTVQRLRLSGPKSSLSEEELDAMIEGFHFIQLLRLRAQHLETEHDSPDDNKINPDTLNELDRRILKEAFRQARKLQLRLKLDYQL